MLDLHETAQNSQESYQTPANQPIQPETLNFREDHTEEPIKSPALLVFSDTGPGSETPSAPNPFQQRMMQRERERQMKQSKPKETKTKEELAKLRKDMMKAKTVKPAANTEELIQDQPTGKKKDPFHQKAALMSRLATGSKPEISKKDMLKLTNKNYENLPEVRKKKEEEMKKEQMRQRLAQVKEQEKQRREQMRASRK